MMKNTRLLFLFWLPWLLKCSCTSNTSSPGSYIVTGNVYYDKKPYGLTSQSNLVAKVVLHSAKPREGEAVAECGRRCIATPPCRSFALKPDRRWCILSALDLCSKPAVLQTAKGYIHYDIRTDDSHTCWDTCIATEDSCAKCGRDNCWGSRCEHCADTCWTTPVPVFDDTWLWTQSTSPFMSTCNGDWQILWDRNHITDTPAGLNLLLRVVVAFKGGTTLTMDFSSVVLLKGVLSVGAPLENLDVTSWWGAPFADRPLSAEGNCRRFFYPSGEECRANGVMSWEEQQGLYNDTLHHGFAWVTGDRSLDNSKIKSIKLWMKPPGDD